MAASVSVTPRRVTNAVEVERILACPEPAALPHWPIDEHAPSASAHQRISASAHQPISAHARLRAFAERWHFLVVLRLGFGCR